MSKLRGVIPLGVVLGAVLVLTGAPEAKASYIMTVSIDDTTTSTVTNYSFNATSANNTYSGTATAGMTVGGGPLNNTSATGLSLSSLGSTTTFGGSSTQLNLGGTATVVNGNTDSFIVTISVTYTGYTTPPGKAATLTQSESGTYSYTTVATPANAQNFQSFYTGPGSPPPTPISPGLQTIVMPVTGSSTMSGSQNNPHMALIPNPSYTMPYSLTDTITLYVTGNTVYSGNNATAGFNSTATISALAVPEPASMVMFLTGMPVPLMVLGILRRRKAAAKG